MPAPIDVFAVRGTGEPYVPGRVSGLLADVTTRLDPRRFRCIELDYPASIGPFNPQRDRRGVAMRRSVDDGVDRLAAAIRRTPNIAGIVSFSLGGIVVSRFLERMHRGDYPDLDVAFAGFVSNPLRAANDSIGNIAPGYGIAGQHAQWPIAVKTWEVANPNDGICSTPALNPLRKLADGLEAFSFADLGGWNQSLIDKTVKEGWQATQTWDNPMEAWRQYGMAVHLLGGYMAPFPHNQHSGYGHFLRPGTNVTYNADLAARINQFVTGGGA